MTKKLKRFIEKGSFTDTDEFPAPRAVLQKAKRFFSLALDGKNGKRPKNPEETANVGAIAIHLLPSVSFSFSEMDRQLKRYSNFIEKLDRPRLFDETEGKIAEELVHFFLGLEQFGLEIRRYERAYGKNYWRRHGVRHFACGRKDTFRHFYV